MLVDGLVHPSLFVENIGLDHCFRTFLSYTLNLTYRLLPSKMHKEHHSKYNTRKIRNLACFRVGSPPESFGLDDQWCSGEGPVKPPLNVLDLGLLRQWEW